MKILYLNNGRKKIYIYFNENWSHLDRSHPISKQQTHTQHESLLNNLKAIFTLTLLILLFYRHKHVVDLSTKLPMDTKSSSFFIFPLTKWENVTLCLSLKNIRALVPSLFWLFVLFSIKANRRKEGPKWKKEDKCRKWNFQKAFLFFFSFCHLISGLSKKRRKRL